MVDSLPVTSIPAWFGQGHLRDDLAKQLQPETPNAVFMCTLKKPQLGMRTETSIQSKEGTWFLMSGTVTWFGESTTSEVLNESDSLFWGIVSGGSANVKFETPEEKRQFILEFFGSVHGQRMKSISRLSRPLGDGDLPFGENRVTEITYRFDDNMYFPWVVEGFRILGDTEIEKLPPFFYEYFEGCSCPRCLEKTADTK